MDYLADQLVVTLHLVPVLQHVLEQEWQRQRFIFFLGSSYWFLLHTTFDLLLFSKLASRYIFIQKKLPNQEGL